MTHFKTLSEKQLKDATSNTAEEESSGLSSTIELLRDEVRDRKSSTTAADAVSYQSLLRDEIRERRNAEEALRHSEQRYRELFHYMSSGVTVYEPVEKEGDFIIRDVNRAGEHIDKLKKQDIIGKKITDIFPNIKTVELFNVLNRVWKTGKMEHLPVWHYKDERISSWRDNHVYKLPTGEIISVYNDVTEQVKAAARESKLLTELKTIFENFPVGIVYLDKQFRIISSNRFFNEFAGFKEKELAGKICYEVVGEFSDDATLNGPQKICSFCKKDECFSLKRPVVTERTIGRKFVRVSTIPELDENQNITRFMEIIEDITERKTAEAEVIRTNHLAALGELAAGVAHEINNPINGIINYTQILANKSQKGSKEHDIACRIIKESDRIANIVSNLLSFARDRKEEKLRINIQDILNDALALTETQIKKDGIRITVNLPSKTPAVLAQPQQIEQVLLNIISNARYALNKKHLGETDKNKLLAIKIDNAMIEDAPYVQITFHDKGTGIHTAMMDKILNPFFTTKPPGIGTGLGLSISHGIISDHGGRLSINSVEGEFTEVVIELPAII